ncbi:hypothetical protein AXK56_05875 [Tsukamurella pulmonis]|uniref:Uncharacterized protein n=1 Tax=Tsukamurella pulmonis TaxID=47312 RepID=A0A1H1CY82_9ACTN|nr:hypothetical protein [Tsukamurella pulmonis]KXO89698.1 hypothetical protein AXK56_05875 [Tsukamurella pulmonis]SDQ69261.1 hypothetical protein SAMN04489765_1446 [Tsukamurella pulmonis]SUP22810.1 Uncharacterised protein [Tsukamurella pulmonis]
MNALEPRGGAVTGTVSDLDLARTVGVFVAAARPAVAGARFVSTLAGLTPIPVVNGYLRRDADGRSRWWVIPVGAVSTVAVAWPGALGVVARLLPLQTYLGFANQTLVVVGVAGEHGVDQVPEQIDLVARVLSRRQIDARTLLGDHPGFQDLVPVRETTDKLRGGVFSAVGAVRDVLGMVKSARSALEARPKPAGVFDTLGKLPVVGAAAGYVGEFATLRIVEARASDGAKILGLEAAFAGGAAPSGIEADPESES